MLTLQIQFRNSYGKLKSEDLKPSNAKQTVPSNPEYITEEVPESSAQRRDEEDRDAKNVTYSEPANFHSQEEGSYQQSGYYSASEILVKEGPEKLEEDEQQQQQQFQSQTDEGFYKAQKFPETRPQNSRRDLTNNRDLPYSYNQQPASDLNDLNKLKDYPKHPNNMVRLSASKIASTQRSSDKSRQQGNSHTFSKGYTKPAPKKGSQLNDEQNLSTSSEKQSQSRLKSSTSMPNNIRSLNTSGLTSESALDVSFLCIEVIYFFICIE